MEQWDRELEQRVWRRVRGESAGLPDLTELIELSRAQAADLKGLDTQLFSQEKQTLSLLVGLHALGGGTERKIIHPASGSRQQRLQRCRQRCEQMLRMLLLLEKHERYGLVFTDLTRLQRAKCARLELLWRSQPGGKKLY